MKGWDKQTNQEKHLFKGYYCVWCKQTKPCGILSWQECCVCFYQGENEKAQQYTNYQQVYQQKKQAQQVRTQQLKLLRYMPTVRSVAVKK